MTTDTDTTRLADIRRRIEIARSDGEDKVALGEYIEFLAHAPSDLEWLLAQLDDATIRGDKLYQYGQTADAAYAELARILRETEEQAQSAQDAANAETARVIEQSALLIEKVKVAYSQQLDAANATITRLQQAAHDIEHGYEMPYERHTYTATDPAADRSGWQERAEVAAAALVEMEAECDSWRERAKGAEALIGEQLRQLAKEPTNGMFRQQ